MKDVWHTVEFCLVLKDDDGVIRFSSASRNMPGRDIKTEERVIQVQLEVPESMFRLPLIRGKLKSVLAEEYQAFMEEMEDM